MKGITSQPTKFMELCIAVKTLKGFTFHTRLRLYVMENLSNRFVLRIKSFIIFSKNDLGIFSKKVLEIQIDSA